MTGARLDSARLGDRGGAADSWSGQGMWMADHGRQRGGDGLECALRLSRTQDPMGAGATTIMPWMTSRSSRCPAVQPNARSSVCSWSRPDRSRRAMPTSRLSVPARAGRPGAGSVDSRAGDRGVCPSSTSGSSAAISCSWRRVAGGGLRERLIAPSSKRSTPRRRDRIADRDLQGCRNEFCRPVRVGGTSRRW